MNRIYIDEIHIQQHIISIHYHVDEKLNVYFNSNTSCFNIKYSCNIESVPPSIAIIPFITNILPIVWLTDSTLIIPELDQTFYESIPQIKEGYANISPMLSFKGNIKVNKIINNDYPTKQNAAFFSGGVDAFATLIAHIQEKPILLTILGADIKLSDKEGIGNIQNQVETTTNQFNLPNAIYIYSNFREFINEQRLSELVKKSKDGWWHGYQHGIGLIGHAAPIAYIHHLKTIYIASSHTIKDQVICASDPRIDNQVKLGNTNIWHDQYDHNRQEKIQLITNFCSNSNQKIKLRVCWKSSGGKNCCLCEKCIRTIMGIIAEGKNPIDYGFSYSSEQFNGIKNSIQKILKETPKSTRPLWADIQNRFKETSIGINDTNINWIYDIDVNMEHHILYKIARSINRLRLKIYYKIKNI